MKEIGRIIHRPLAYAGITALMVAIIVACGPSALATPANGNGDGQTTQVEDATIPTNTVERLEDPMVPYSGLEETGPYAVPGSTPAPKAAAAASNEIVLVTQVEPGTLGTWNQDCGGSLSTVICADIASDPFTWIDSGTFEVVPLTGIDSWSQQAQDRWRFKLREGITFHNGEPWDARAAKAGFDYLGDLDTFGHGNRAFGFHGVVSGKVVDKLTIDVTCEAACPIFPRTAISTTFQAPEWWEEVSVQESSTMTVGLGPYRIVEYVPGTEVRLEAYEDYKPNIAVDAQTPAIKRARQIWHPEPLARAALLRAGEAHWASNVGFEYVPAVPRFKTGTTPDIFALVADNIWHPELKKKGVREALALAVDCELLMDVLYDGLQRCIGNISHWGTVGVNESNSAPYGYNPVRARQLLEDSGYDYENVIAIHARLNPVFRGLEMLESVVTMWEAVGVNAELVVLDPASARDYRRSGCGQLEGAETQLQCVEMAPPEPVGASTHYYETVTSNETLDMQRQLLLRGSCHSVNSRVCNLAPGLEGMTYQESIADAIGTPMGTARTRKLEALSQIIHDEFWFLPLFAPVEVYGLSDNLEWEPRHDRRLRLNTMKLTQ